MHYGQPTFIAFLDNVVPVSPFGTPPEANQEDGTEDCGEDNDLVYAFERFPSHAANLANSTFFLPVYTQDKAATQDLNLFQKEGVCIRETRSFKPIASHSELSGKIVFW